MRCTLQVAQPQQGHATKKPIGSSIGGIELGQSRFAVLENFRSLYQTSLTKKRASPPSAAARASGAEEAQHDRAHPNEAMRRHVCVG